MEELRRRAEDDEEQFIAAGVSRGACVHGILPAITTLAGSEDSPHQCTDGEHFFLFSDHDCKTIQESERLHVTANIQMVPAVIHSTMYHSEPLPP